MALDAFASARIRGRDDHMRTDWQRVGGHGLLRIDFDAVERSERLGRKPRRIHEQEIFADERDGGFQMQATADFDLFDGVTVRGENRAQLADGVMVRSAGNADEDAASSDENVAAIDRAGRFDLCQCAIRPKRFRDGGRLAATRGGSWAHDDRDFGKNDGGVFDENAIGHVLGGRKTRHTAAGFGEALFVFGVLGASDGYIDGFALQMGKFAARDGGADFARESDEHGESLAAMRDGKNKWNGKAEI